MGKLRVRRLYPEAGEVEGSKTAWEWFDYVCPFCQRTVRLPHRNIINESWERTECRGERRYSEKRIKHRRTDIPGRQCKVCLEYKPASEFSRDKVWLRRECKSCRARAEKTRYNTDETAKDPLLNAWFSGKWRVKVEEDA